MKGGLIMPYVMLAEAGAGAFDLSTSLETAKTVITWIFDVVKGEPLMSAAFVIGLLVPAGFYIVHKVKGASK